MKDLAEVHVSYLVLTLISYMYLTQHPRQDLKIQGKRFSLQFKCKFKQGKGWTDLRPLLSVDAQELGDLHQVDG